VASGFAEKRGLSRRGMLGVGTLGLFGLTLPELLAGEAGARARPLARPAGFGRARSCLLIWLKAFVTEGPRLTGWAWRPAILITLAVVAFAVLIDRLGLIAAMLASMTLAALGTPEAHYDAARAADYLAKVDDALGLYRGAHGAVHPGFYLDQANRSIDRNVKMGPWIHVGSAVRHLGGARVGDRLATRGKVRSLFEKNGREFVEVDLIIVAGETPRPVAHILHTAIYRLPAPA